MAKDLVLSIYKCMFWFDCVIAVHLCYLCLYELKCCVLFQTVLCNERSSRCAPTHQVSLALNHLYGATEPLNGGIPVDSGIMTFLRVLQKRFSFDGVLWYIGKAAYNCCIIIITKLCTVCSNASVE